MTCCRKDLFIQEHPNAVKIKFYPYLHKNRNTFKSYCIDERPYSVLEEYFYGLKQGNFQCDLLTILNALQKPVHMRRRIQYQIIRRTSDCILYSFILAYIGVLVKLVILMTEVSLILYLLISLTILFFLVLLLGVNILVKDYVISLYYQEIHDYFQNINDTLLEEAQVRLDLEVKSLLVKNTMIMLDTQTRLNEIEDIKTEQSYLNTPREEIQRLNFTGFIVVTILKGVA